MATVGARRQGRRRVQRARLPARLRRPRRLGALRSPSVAGAACWGAWAGTRCRQVRGDPPCRGAASRRSGVRCSPQRTGGRPSCTRALSSTKRESVAPCADYRQDARILARDRAQRIGSGKVGESPIPAAAPRAVAGTFWPFLGFRVSAPAVVVGHKKGPHPTSRCGPRKAGTFQPDTEFYSTSTPRPSTCPAATSFDPLGRY